MLLESKAILQAKKSGLVEAVAEIGENDRPYKANDGDRQVDVLEVAAKDRPDHVGVNRMHEVVKHIEAIAHLSQPAKPAQVQKSKAVAVWV